VGPNSTLELSVRRRGKDSVVMLQSRRVIPDLAKSIAGALVREARVRCVK
jgi:hypothetical protein